MELDTIENALVAFRAGEPIVVVDDTDRENEGDLIMAASKATPEKMAFMIRHTSGIICAPLTPERAEELHLPPMVANNMDPLRTAFTVSVDYKIGMTTGIAAEERTQTVRALGNDNADAGDFLRPGHVFPLIARPGGVLIRSGHTEAGVDLCRLAGEPLVGVLAEVVNDDGTVKRLPQLVEFSAEHGLKIISIEDLIAYRIRTETFVQRVSESETTINGLTARIIVYCTPFDPMQHVVAVFGDVAAGSGVPCRIHREQPIRDLVGKVRDNRSWVDHASEVIGHEGRGVLIYLRSATVDPAEIIAPNATADERHGSAVKRMQRWREVGIGAQILRDLGIGSIALIANAERQYVGLGGFGIGIERTITVEE